MGALARQRNIKAITDPLRTILYLRQSDETKGEETISDEIQEGKCRRWCAENNAVVANINEGMCHNGIIWEQKSGRIWYKRKGVQLAMELIREDKADVVVLWRWNRLSRIRRHWGLAEEAFASMGGRAVSATEPADLNTKEGRFSQGLWILLAELESDTIGDGWRDTHQVRRDRGLPASGGKRFGYTLVRETGKPERYKRDEETRDVAKWMYDEYIAGRTIRNILDGLNLKGIKNARDRVWQATAVQYYLDSGFAAGLLMRTGWDSSNAKVIVPPFAEREWIRGTHVPIISNKCWEQYRATRNRRATVAPRVRHPAHPFAGLIRCGDCQGAMSRSKSKSNEVYFTTVVCSRWTEDRTVRCVSCKFDRIVNAALEWLAEIANEIEEESNTVEFAERRYIRARTNINDVKREISELKRKMALLTRQKLDEEIPKVAYDATIGPLTDELKQAEERLEVAVVESARPARAPRAIAKDLLRDWDILPIDQRRLMCAELIETITIYPPDQRGRPSRIEITPRFVA